MANTQIVLAASDLTILGERRTATLEVMGEELRYAWDRADSAVLVTWGTQVASDFAGSLGRRLHNLITTAGRVLQFAADEVTGATHAFSNEELATHLKGRLDSGVAAGQDWAKRSANTAGILIDALRSDPKSAGLDLLNLVVLSSVAYEVAGGFDGNGGVPDLDIPLAGIGAHRSLFTHSILMGATLETGILALMRLVQLLHQHLPANHHRNWDEMLGYAAAVARAANQGASLGLAFHFTADGLFQPGAYHGFPVSMPLELHQTIQTAQGVVELQDTFHKPEAARPPTPQAASQAWFEEVDLPWKDAYANAARLRNPSEHRAALSKRLYLPEHVRLGLNDFEVQKLLAKGFWMANLASGILGPITPAQERFVEVTWGRAAPREAYERLWVKYVRLRYARKVA